VQAFKMMMMEKLLEWCSLAFPPKYTTACLLILGLRVHVQVQWAKNAIVKKVTNGNSINLELWTIKVKRSKIENF